ncbi:MAG: ankyrin repeat domain-containing protein [Gammaproteobacteria bacterium]|nr:ankyrin repeat domain-containing protein [Gammaproteobacteria bacterium]MDE2345228.1 ankyrin repeat domain-containing protein [Gammaproteobacteria bacterium]
MPGAVAPPPSLDQLLLAKAADAPAVDIQILIRRGANVNVQGRFGVTPLMQAVIGNNSAVVRLLLTTGADPGLRNLRGDTALDLARLLGRRNIEQILAAAGKVRDATRVYHPVPAAEVHGGTLEQLLVRRCACRASRQLQALQSQHPERGNGQIPGTHQCS